MSTDVRTFKREIAGRELVIETGKLAKQAHGSCTVRYGDSVILATAVQNSSGREGMNFFPLMVDFEEKMYAAGKIKGSRFIKREGRPTEQAVLYSRIIDRSIRPLFDQSDRRDVQVVATALAYDPTVSPEILGLIGASVSLAMSPILWNGPIAACKVAKVDGEYVVNPSREQLENCDLQVLFVSSEDEAVMIETEAKEANEDDVYKAFEIGLKTNKEILGLIKEVIEAVGKEKEALPELDAAEAEAQKSVTAKVDAYLEANPLASAFGQKTKEEFKSRLDEIKGGLQEMLKDDSDVSKEDRAKAMSSFDSYLEVTFHREVMNTGIRPDGRQIDEVRHIAADTNLLPQVHGSGLFERGETQALSIVTLGGPGDEQLLDTMEENDTKLRYFHHYNFPGYSVGEAKPNRGAGRREIGHGALAEKAILPVLPAKEDFPYTIRVVSEILGSNGSSSQASACGSSLALMDAGVPILRPVAGIAMGLVVNPEDHSDYKVLTDIQGIEDSKGDMDFKVAGTSEGVTAIQLDIKLDGISLDICKDALAGAKAARLHILEVMAKAIDAPRPELNDNAPRIISIKIPVDKIREVIGAGGKVINKIIDECEVDIDIEDDGMVMITSTNQENGAKALEWVKNIITDVEAGTEYDGTVTRIMDFGAFVEVLPGKEGLVHISEMAWGRVEKVEDVLKEGDKIKVKCTEIDSQGRTNLSMKALMPKPEGYVEQPARPRPTGGRGNGRDNRSRGPRR